MASFSSGGPANLGGLDGSWRTVRSLLLLSIVGFAAGSAGAGPAAGLRQVINFNRDWRFQLGDVPAAAQPTFDDRSWSRIGLPHSFSEPYFAAGYQFYVGYGWYRKRFTVPETWRGRRLFLDFDGAFQDAEIFVNGVRVGTHRGGYTGFELEFTGAAKTGENVVAVRLNNRWNPRLAPRAGEHVFSGGLYRDVRLVVTAPVHVTWYGTFVTTPALTNTGGAVNLRTEIVNESATPQDCRLHTEIIDPSGRVVAAIDSERTIAAGETTTLEQTSGRVASPELWSPEHPALYRAVSTVSAGGAAVDRFETPFGFRTIAWTADRGFFLNGAHRYLRGANVHQDHAGWGDAVTDAGAARDVQLMKDAGFDFIRGSHYPHAPAFARACDEIGMLFWSENCFWGTAGFPSPWGSSAYPTDPADAPSFEASVRASLRDMIRINRNHPSIVAWSMGNEVFFSAPQVLPEVRRFLKELVAYSHELDPTRPAAIGGAQRGQIDTLGDVAGYNGDGARLPEFLHPTVANLVSEYGSTVADRPGPYAPGWGDLPDVPGLDTTERYPWRFAWRSGEAIWCGFDHGSIAGRHFGAMGIVDYFRLPKRQWYWYRNEYRHIPPPAWPQAGMPAALQLTADRSALRAVDGTDDAQIVVTVVDARGQPLSNSPPVTLTIESGPGEFPTGSSITFAPDSDIAIRDGAAAIEFRSYYGGETTIRATSPGLRDATLALTSLGEPTFVPGQTPTPAPRPYVRYTDPVARGAVVSLGRENPTRASSEAAGHSGFQANDANRWTEWLAAEGDTRPWWQVDLERDASIQTIALTFPGDGIWRYRVTVSDDAQTWRKVAENTVDAHGRKEHTDKLESDPRGTRYVRVTLLQWPQNAKPGLAEFEARGSLVDSVAR